MSTLKAKAAPQIVLREEYEDRFLLFDPDTGRTLGLNDLGVFIWRNLDGNNQVDDIVLSIEKEFDGVSGDVVSHVEDFVNNLHDNKMILLVD